MSTLQRGRAMMPDLLDWFESPFLTLRPYLAQDIRLEDYLEDDRYVVRAELAGIDPEKDLAITVGLTAAGRVSLTVRHAGEESAQSPCCWGPTARSRGEPASEAGNSRKVRRRIMSCIIVGTDGSAHSQRAVDWAARAAALYQVRLIVLTAYQARARDWGGEPRYPDDNTLRERALAIAQEQADKALSQLGDRRPPSVEVRAASGIPADQLIGVADDADAEMIVVAARGTGGFKRLLLGSVSTQLTHYAHHPVVVIPVEDTHRPGYATPSRHDV